jgi:hypothetical protein
VGRLRDVARHLPDGVLVAFEARLAPEDETVDLSVRLRRPSEVRDPARMPQIPRIPMPPAVHEFLSRWASGGPLARVPSVWLEFDLPAQPDPPAAPGLPVPSVCARLPMDAGPGWLADTLLPALTGESPSPGLRALLLRCLAAIPSPARPLYLFRLFPRQGSPVRLEIFGLDPDGIASYLRRVAPASEGSGVAAARLLAGAERLHLSFDLGFGGCGEVLPRIGVEGSFPRLPRREPRWAELFDRLVDRGLCAPAKRDAALAWPGYDSFWTVPDRWPEAAGTGGFCARALSHVKLVSRPDREPEAKVYLLLERLGAKGSKEIPSSPARASVRSR